MDDLAFIYERIESYADYANRDDPYLADKQIRAFVGEALSQLRERLHPDSDDDELLDALLMHCEFPDQALIRALDHALLDDDTLARVHALDRELVTLADRAKTVPAAELPTFFASVNDAFDRRRAAIANAPSRYAADADSR